MNIDKAIAEKSYVIQGVKDSLPPDPSKWPPEKRGAPSPVNARLFAIAINEKTSTGYEVLNIVFDLGSCWGAHYGMKTPKKEPFTRRMYINSKGLLDVSDKFRDEVVSNQALRQLFVDYIKSCRNRNEEGMVRNATQHFDKLSFSRQKALMNDIESKAAHDAKVKAACEYAKQKAGNKEYSYYSEYYIPGRQAHDDDYEGSGPCSIETIVKDMGYVDNAKIDELIDILDKGTTVTDVDGHVRTYYALSKKSGGKGVNAGLGECGGPPLNENNDGGIGSLMDISDEDLYIQVGEWMQETLNNDHNLTVDDLFDQNAENEIFDDLADCPDWSEVNLSSKDIVGMKNKIRSKMNEWAKNNGLTIDEGKNTKKINENRKVTLSIGQIKQIILEAEEEVKKAKRAAKPDNAELIREEYRNPFRMNVTFDEFKEMVRAWDRRPFKKNASILGEFSDDDRNISLSFAKFSRAIPDENVRIFLVHDKQDRKTTIIAADNPGSLAFELENLFDIGDMRDQAKQIYKILADRGDVAFPVEPGKWKFGEVEDYENADVAIRRMR